MSKNINNIHFVTGAAGFIGSTLVDRLLSEGRTVIGYDNFSTGNEHFLSDAIQNQNFTLVRGDTLDAFTLTASLRGCSTVWHLAANADVRFGTEHPRKDLEQNTVAVANILEAMRVNGVCDILFSSTGSVYGEASMIPTPEDAPFPIQTSFYGASKLAGEGMIAAYCAGFGFRGAVFRFVSMLGERYTHGHVFDFVRHLLREPERLPVLGDGTQRKSYLYVGDCAAAMLRVHSAMPGGFNVFNLGTDDYCTVRDSIGWICRRMNLKPALEFTGGDRGWTGDNPFIYLDTKKIRARGWNDTMSIQNGIERTVDWLLENKWVFEVRQ
jgi:UDP-glucose 4-epimerase